MCQRMEIVDDTLRTLFRRLGRCIGNRPGYFVIVPILISALCASGFQRIVFEADPEYLFSPVDGEGKTERAILEHHFPMNYTAFDPGRMSRSGRFGRLIFQARDNGTLLRTRHWAQIARINDIVMNTSIEYKGQLYNFSDLCATWQGSCWENEILGLGKYMEDIESGVLPITYPIWFDPETFYRYTFPFFTGGVKLTDDFTIDKLSKVALNYFLKSTTKEDVILGTKWEAEFLQNVKDNAPLDVEVLRFSSLTLESELENNTNSVLPFFTLNVLIMIFFCVVTCMMTDWVKSKPLLGLLGVVSSILGTIAALGLAVYVGIPFTGINLAAPFLMLGIGIDDTFVMLGAWRRTSVHSAVPERMAEAFEDAAVSITITSVTNMISFWIGVITPFPSVQIFCIYTGLCVVFTYVYHVTFFGACMALAGYAEKDNRHALTCLRVKAKSQSKSKGFLYKMFCVGGINPEDPHNPIDNVDNGVMVFFRDYVGAALNKVGVKMAVLFLFLSYLAVSGWGVSLVKEGLERKNLARFDSYSVQFYEIEDGFFRDYPYRVNVVISGALNYSDTQVQNDLEDLLSSLENTTYIDPIYTESWLRDFTDYVRRNEEFTPIDITTETNFIKSLNSTYLNDPSSRYSLDVDFSDDGRHILGTRFVIQGAHIYNTNMEKQFVEELRAVCHASPYNVSVYHPYFVYFDQFLMVLPTTIQCVTLAAVIMMVISLIFIPNPLCSLWVAFSIVSIELGVLGFMTLWGINLDSLSMINLIMCIGFSVDFSAHVSYHFMSRQNMNIRERVRDSMYALGMPIVQGACSTIIGVIGLAMAPSYIFITFFKMVFLVIVLGALHGLILLPVLLSLFGPGACDRSGSKKAALGQAASCDNQNVDVVVAPQLAVVVPVSNGKLAAQQNHYPHSNGKKHYQNGGPPGGGKYSHGQHVYEIKIPRPKHGPLNGHGHGPGHANGHGHGNGSAGSCSNHSYSQSNGGSRASSRPRSSSASPAPLATPKTGPVPYGRQKLSVPVETSVGIKLREMYTNRAFVCEDDYRRHQRALQ